MVNPTQIYLAFYKHKRSWRKEPWKTAENRGKPRIFIVPKYDTQEVTTELLTVAQKLNGFVYASCYGCKTKEQAVQYRHQFSQRELMLILGDFLSFNTATK